LPPSVEPSPDPVCSRACQRGGRHPSLSQPKESCVKMHKPELCPLQEKFLTTRRELSAALIERDEEVDLVLTALVAQEHPLLVGPPGTAKSLLLDSLMQLMHGKKFTVLLTKFSTPEELFGPISVAGLKEDKYRRI